MGQRADASFPPSAELRVAATTLRMVARPWGTVRGGWALVSQPDPDDRATWRTIAASLEDSDAEWASLASPGHRGVDV